MNTLAVFEFESYPVRFVGTADDPWWVASDVCTVLDIGNVSQALQRLDSDEKRDDITINDVIGRTQSVWCINESGLYSLILTSRKSQAKRFKKWITSEVIPSIRQTGGYSLNPPANIPSMKEISDLIELTLGNTDLDKRLVAGVKLNAIVSYNPVLQPAVDIAKSALSIPVDDELVRPTRLAEILAVNTGEKWSAIRVNKLLVEQGFQTANSDKNPAYLPTEKGKPHSQIVLDTAKGRDKTVQSLQWHLSVLDAIEV